MAQTVDITFWDVQHGHATYINSPNGKRVVVDLGIGDYSGGQPGFSPLRQLYDNGARNLDYVVITHPHLDHIDDILNFDALNPTVLSRPRHLSKDEILSDVRTQDRPKFDKYFEIDDRYSGALSAGNDPHDSGNFGGMEIQVFGATQCSHSNINNHSKIVIVTFADIKVVIPGDNEQASFEELLKNTAFRAAVRNCDVLLAPHHGRDSGYHNEFMNLANPRLTVISDGRFCDTSATARYCGKTRGWDVAYADGTVEERQCLTTRSDGSIYVSFGYRNDGKRFLSVRTEN